MDTGQAAQNLQDQEDLAPTDWEHAVELDSPFGSDAEIWGSPCIDFSPAELKLLLAASQLADEDSIDFIKRAAMERIADVLTDQRSTAPSAPAAGS